MKMLGKERLESDVFFSSSSAWRNSVIPSITRILVAFTSCFNPRKWISQDGFLLLFGKLSHVVISFFFLSLSFLFLHQGKKVVLSPGHERIRNVKRKGKRKLFDCDFHLSPQLPVLYTRFLGRASRETSLLLVAARRKQTSTYYVDAHAITVIINGLRVKRST